MASSVLKELCLLHSVRIDCWYVLRKLDREDQTDPFCGVGLLLFKTMSERE